MMRDVLEKLRLALHATVPQAPDEVRRQTICDATAAFNRHHQGSRVANDELERLRLALHATVPQAPDEVRKQTICDATAAFNRHYQRIGNEKHRNQAVPSHTLFIFQIRRLTMILARHLSRPSRMFAGSAAAIVVGVITYQMLAPHLPYPSNLSLTGSSTGGLMSMPSTTGQVDLLRRSTVQSNVPDSLRLQRTQSLTAESFEHHDGIDYQGRDRFTAFDPNAVKLVTREPLSTFSIDVDTTSYAFLRASLNQGYLPPNGEAIRIEELINYFTYDYPPPETRDPPFAAHVSLMPAPWNDRARLMRIGIKGYELDQSTAPRANLVFLIDTSGSMNEPNKLPLLIRSLKLLLTALSPDDRVAIVSYAGSAGVLLEPTPVSERRTILAALDHLGAGGSTAGAEGIRQAYDLAERHLIGDGINRVILATDGDFNVGITDPEALEDFISHKRSSGVSLSVLGFGMGNYNDELMQHLAQSGNGNAAYIDSLSEARKVLLEQVTSTLVTIAKDVKIQVEFNPATVREYRLIGYETRRLAAEHFRNDKVDAGEIGAGHTVTALYEIILEDTDGSRIPPLRYQDTKATTKADFNDEFAFLKIRYKLPNAQSSTLITQAVTAADVFKTVDAAPHDMRFAAAVAAFGELLHGGQYTGEYSYDDVVALALGARGEDPLGYRNEFIRLVHLAESATITEP